MTTEQKQYSKAFEYARSKIENGDWSWEQAFECCKQAYDAASNKEANAKSIYLTIK